MLLLSARQGSHGGRQWQTYDKNQVNNVTEENKPEQEYEDAQVGAVANLSPYHHLNW